MPVPYVSPGTKQTAQAVKINKKASRAMRHRKHAKAISGYIEALTLDPSSGARYNLVAAYARAGQMDNAINLLAQFKRADCPMCLYRLLATQEGGIFKELRADPRYPKIIEGVTFVPPDYAAIAKDVLAKLKAKDDSPWEATLKAGFAIKYTHEQIETEQMGEGGRETVDQKKNSTQVQDAPRLTWMVRALRSHGMELDQARATCKKRCCSITGTQVTHNDSERAISEICFWPTSATQALPVSVTFFQDHQR